MKKSVKRILALISFALFMFVSAVPVLALEANQFPLFAGKSWEVGYVEVINDDDNFYIDYHMYPDIAEDDWAFTQLHLAVELMEEDVPQTSKGNPIPGALDLKWTLIIWMV